MSAALDMADKLRTRLVTEPVAGEIATPVHLSQVPVIVWRQEPAMAKIEAAVGKGLGCCIVIAWNGFQTSQPDAKRPRLAHSFTLGVWSRQIIDKAARPADDVVESIVNRLWHWVPDAGHAHHEARVVSADLVPDKEFLVYELEVTVPVSL